MIYKKREYTREGDQFYIDGVEVPPSGWAFIGSGIRLVLALYVNGGSVDVWAGSQVRNIPKNRFVPWVDHGYKVGDYVQIRKKLTPEYKGLDYNLWFWSETPNNSQGLGNIERIHEVRDFGYTIGFSNHQESFLIIDKKLTDVEIRKIEIAEAKKRKKEALEKMIKIFEERLESQTGDLGKKAQTGLRDFVLSSKKIESLVAGFNLKQSVKDFMDNFEEGIEKIRKHKGILGVEGDYSMLAVLTDHIFLEFGKSKEYVGIYSGKFKIEIEILNQKVNVRPVDMPWIDKYAHPHVSSSGVICWGNMSSGVAAAFKEFDVYNVFIHAFESLHGVTGSTYFSIFNRNVKHKKELSEIFKKIPIKYEWTEHDFSTLCEDCDCEPCVCDECCSWCEMVECECEPCGDCGAMPWNSCSC